MIQSIAAEPVPLHLDQHGVMRVGGTRVTLDTVITVFRAGATAEEIVQRFPTLDLADVYVAIGYYLRRREEVDQYLSERRQRGDKVRKQNQMRFDQHGLRERLLARQTAQKVHVDATASR